MTSDEEMETFTKLLDDVFNQISGNSEMLAEKQSDVAEILTKTRIGKLSVKTVIDSIDLIKTKLNPAMFRPGVEHALLMPMALGILMGMVMGERIPHIFAKKRSSN